ncbi:MAG: toxin-antitoxin system YwqK family antitoxin [Lewinellaceae bacterium]|nr:toxin-antitoxin system YwqK family antitoxin [Phaeodactylibacter sp.]MCB9349110.1 toxin-antitoxin system YwqK family antitoxin [Lewinellaceae bacterium]
MTRILFLAASLVFLSTCNNGSPTTGAETKTEQFDAAGYSSEDIPGTEYSRATKRGVDNTLQEEGLLRNGVREGAWIIYHPDGIFPEKIITYADGKYNGPYFEFNERGQLELRATYMNNALDGPWGKYRFGRPETEASYKNGQFDGAYKEYDIQSGKLVKEVNYKQGKQHGMLRFFNEAGEVTLEYEYKDGEKVGGGIVEAPSTGNTE